MPCISGSPRGSESQALSSSCFRHYGQNLSPDLNARSRSLCLLDGCFCRRAQLFSPHRFNRLCAFLFFISGGSRFTFHALVFYVLLGGSFLVGFRVSPTDQFLLLSVMLFAIYLVVLAFAIKFPCGNSNWLVSFCPNNALGLDYLCFTPWTTSYYSI
jgi:hypothetical protein